MSDTKYKNGFIEVNWPEYTTGKGDREIVVFNSDQEVELKIEKEIQTWLPILV